MSAPLERLQVIKGWIENGEKKEQVFDVACATGSINNDTNRCEMDGSSSSLDNCDVGKGASRLSVVWQDPDFRQNAEAFYYVRGLEVSTCRWSNWDAIRLGKKHNPELATQPFS